MDCRGVGLCAHLATHSEGAGFGQGCVLSCFSIFCLLIMNEFDSHFHSLLVNF